MPSSLHRREIPWYHTRQPPARSVTWPRERVFLHYNAVPSTHGGSPRLLKSLCDGSGESRQKARRKFERGLVPNEHVVADAKRAF